MKNKGPTIYIDKKPTIFEMLEYTEHDEDWLNDRFDMGCKYEDWKEKARAYRDNCLELTKSWDTLYSQAPDPISTHRDVALGLNSPLEALSTYVRALKQYPPPEVLLVIANQFKYYMENAGNISLEEAFFGSTKGKGTYAFRCHHENPLYELFDMRLSLEEVRRTVDKGPLKSQQEVLDHLLETPMYSMEDGVKTQIGVFFAVNQKGPFDSDSFLRGYRRRKKRFDDKTDK